MRKPYQVREVIPKPNGFSVCVHCGNKAAKESLFNGGGITIVEKYCDACLQTETFSAIMTWYASNER